MNTFKRDSFYGIRYIQLDIIIEKYLMKEKGEMI